MSSSNGFKARYHLKEPKDKLTISKQRISIRMIQILARAQALDTAIPITPALVRRALDLA